MEVNLKPQHEQTVLGQLITIQNAINYHNKTILPKLDSLNKSDKKDYEEAYLKYCIEKQEKINYINDHKEVFNDILKEYNLTTSLFIEKVQK